MLRQFHTSRTVDKAINSAFTVNIRTVCRFILMWSGIYIATHKFRIVWQFIYKKYQFNIHIKRPIYIQKSSYLTTHLPTKLSAQKLNKCPQTPGNKLNATLSASIRWRISWVRCFWMLFCWWCILLEKSSTEPNQTEPMQCCVMGWNGRRSGKRRAGPQFFIYFMNFPLDQRFYHMHTVRFCI